MTARERDWVRIFFLQPEVRRSVLGGYVCVMRIFATALAEEHCACIRTAAGWFLGPREARGDRFCKDNLWATLGLASSVAAWSADDFTVRRGATRPVAPWRASAIAAHFILQ